MRTLLIDYDLNKVGQNYDSLISAIKRIANGYWHHLDSTWLIRTNDSPATVRDTLLSHIDANDELLVMDVTGAQAAWYGFTQSSSDWLRTHL